MFQINSMPQSIDIGFTGETAFRKVEIDMSAWLRHVPDGTPSIVLIRPGETDAEAYIAATTMEGNVLTWEVTAGDLGERDGEGLMQIWMEETENDSVVKRGKSVLIRTRVHRAINDADETVPAAQEAWMEQMISIRNKVVKTATVQEPRIVDGYWYVYDPETGEYINTQVSATGPRGPRGEPGDILGLYMYYDEDGDLCQVDNFDQKGEET